MPQTKFVLNKALAAKLRPIVVINKVDKEARRVPGGVENEVFDLVCIALASVLGKTDI